MVLNWRRRQYEDQLQHKYEAGLGPAQLAEKKARGERIMRKVLARWHNQEQAAAVSSWQRNLADSDIINMHHQMQWDTATRIMMGWLRRNESRRVQLVVRMWGRQPLNLFRMVVSHGVCCLGCLQVADGAVHGRNYLLGRLRAGAPIEGPTQGREGDAMSLRLFNIMAQEAQTRKLEKCVNQVALAIMLPRLPARVTPIGDP